MKKEGDIICPLFCFFKTDIIFMEKKILELENDFSAFFRYGYLVLNRTKNEIREYFPENQLTVLPDLGDDSLVEIRFNHGTLTCQIGSDGICCVGFFFFDDSDMFNVYREICNDKCEIIIPNVWKYDNYYIELKESPDIGFYFAFCRQYNLFGNLFC